MTRREFLSAVVAVPLAAAVSPARPPVDQRARLIALLRADMLAGQERMQRIIDEAYFTGRYTLSVTGSGKDAIWGYYESGVGWIHGQGAFPTAGGQARLRRKLLGPPEAR